MKYSVYLISLILTISFIFVTTACEEALEEEAFSFISKSDFYDNEEDAEAAVLGIYWSLLLDDVYGRLVYDITHLLDDQCMIHRNPVFIDMDNFNFTSDHPLVTDLWRGHYRTIELANVAISRLRPIEGIDPSTLNSFIAEAHFLRANMYFNLVRLFGSVPLALEETVDIPSSNIPMGKVEEIYTVIIDDLSFAEQNLPLTRPAEELGRATGLAAKTMLADVYLTRENWSEAAQKAKEVIDAGQFELLESFSEIFSPNNEANPEIIHSVVFDGQLTGNWMASFAHAGGGENPNCNAGVQVWQVDQQSDMWLNWDDNDPRKAHTVYTEFITRSGELRSVFETARPYPAFGKYNAPGEVALNRCPINVIIYRYADLLLMYAEALSQATGGPTLEAYEAVNNVRRRAYKQPLNQISEYDLPSDLNVTAFREAVLRERSHELVIEGKRAFDLLRTNSLIEILQRLEKTVRPGARLLPIPQVEIDANAELTNDVQNAGY